MPLIRTVTCRVRARKAHGTLSGNPSRLVQVELSEIGGWTFAVWHYPSPESWEGTVRDEAHDYIISRVFER